jgi:hypothetical protein
MSSQTDSELAQVIWGSSSGLGEGRASSELTQTDFGRTVTAGDQLGYAVDAPMSWGPTCPWWRRRSGRQSLAKPTAGLSDPRAVDADSAGIPGAAEAGDRFGETITLGLLAGTSNRVDGLVGVPHKDLDSGTSTITNAGAIVVINDLHTGVVAGQAF